MRESLVETLLGIIVVAVAGAFLWFSLGTNGGTGSGDRYEVIAEFENASGVDRGSEVRSAGVKIGVVSEKRLGDTGARLVLRIEDEVALASDSLASIKADGLLGGSFVDITRGRSDDRIATDGSGQISRTRPAIDLIDAVASFTGAGGGPVLSEGSTYRLSATFNNINGITVGSDVKYAGVKVGEVREIDVNYDFGEATVVMRVDDALELAEDADARIISGLLGGAYIAIEQGGSLDTIATDGSGSIRFTRGSVDLLTLFASIAGGGDDGGDDSAAAGDPYE